MTARTHRPTLGVAALLVLAAVSILAFGSIRTAAHEGSKAAPVPLSGFTTHVVATHYLGKRSYKSEHYFKQIKPGLLQGLVVRSIEADARIMEVEWAISADRYRRLPKAQRHDWHPLAPAVDAGRIRVPDASAEDEKAALKDIRGLYAQTLNLAGIDGELPTGPSGVRSVTHLAPGERMAGH